MSDQELDDPYENDFESDQPRNSFEEFIRLQEKYISLNNNVRIKGLILGIGAWLGHLGIASLVCNMANVYSPHYTLPIISTSMVTLCASPLLVEAYKSDLQRQIKEFRKLKTEEKAQMRLEDGFESNDEGGDIDGSIQMYDEH